jgi:hypothetical protein
MQQEGGVDVRYCPTYWMPADLMTKPLDMPTFQRLRGWVMGGQWHDLNGILDLLGANQIVSVSKKRVRIADGEPKVTTVLSSADPRSHTHFTKKARQHHTT